MLKVITKENSEVSISVVTLVLIYETINFNQEYCSLSCSYGYLPQIFILLKLLNVSFIENIFTIDRNDVINDGNSYLTFSEHFSQLTSVKRYTNRL